MKELFLVLFFVLFANNSFAQNNYQRHIVKKGETVYSISKKFNVSEATIYQLNPDLKHVIKTGIILILPNNGEEVIVSIKKYRVRKRETIKSIATKYDISKDLLKKYNKDLYAREPIKGERIDIPVFNVIALSNTTNKETLTANDTIKKPIYS